MTDLDPAELEGSVDLWICVPEEIEDPALLARYAELLDEEERARWRRFRFARDRHRFLVTRALIRTVLSRYVDLPPSEWRFTRNRWGKPEIVAELNALDLRPNLAHTAGMICCAVTRHADVGVDVEHLLRKSATLKVAERFFAADEVAQLRASGLAERAELFFRFWTLKEAYLKARGIGVAAGLGNFAFDLRGEGPISVQVAPGFDGDPERWHFALIRPDSGHLIALASAVPARATPPRVVQRRAIPLDGQPA